MVKNVGYCLQHLVFECAKNESSRCKKNNLNIFSMYFFTFRNLLVPPGCGHHGRQKARIQVKVYQAQDLPFMNMGILAGVKKVFSGEKADLVDPYVQVSFGGLKV